MSPDLTVPRYETRIEVDTGTGAHADFAVADFNGDRQVDMAVISLTGELKVLLGSGSVFAGGPPMNLGGSPVWMDKGDVDGDGDIDLCISQTGSGNAQLLLNDGNANFTLGPTFPVGAGALQVMIADANDDGHPDVLVARPFSPEIVVFEGDGTGQFTAGASFVLPGGGQSFTMALGDVTRDGLSDLVVSDPTLDRVLVFPGRVLTNDFNPEPMVLDVPGGPAACSLGDLNNDGALDIAVSAYSANRFVVITDLGTGGNTYTSFNVPVGASPALSVIGDVTGDGRADLVASVISQASMVIVPQLANGTLGAPFLLDATGLPLRPALADVDRNGRVDLLALSGLADRVNLWLARNTGELVGSRSWDTGLSTSNYTIMTDLDGDNLPEIVVGNNSNTRLSIMRRRNDGVVEVATTVELGRRVFNVRAADLDVDGRDDLIVPVDNGVKLVHNLSTPGNFAFEVLPGTGAASFGTGTGPFGAAAADLDRDGRLDLAIADFQTGELMVLRGNAQPFDFASPPRRLSIGGGPIDVAAADFTGDGIVDLAVSRATQSDIMLFRNDGLGNMSLFVNLPVGLAPNYLLTSDFNRDGRADLVVSNGASESISVLFGGAQGFTAASYAAGSTPTALVVGDMTGDRVPDILVASLTGGDFRVLVNNGAGSFDNVFPFPGTLGASGAALGDIDGDGDLDLVIASMITNRISLVTSIAERATGQL